MKKAIITALSVMAGTIVGAGAVRKSFLEKKQQIQLLADKHLSLFLMMNQWVKVKQEGKNLSTYFERIGYKDIAIYGMSYAGETLIEELQGTNTKVIYGIDKKADAIDKDVDVVSINDELEKVDAIVVTAITFFSEIEEQLSKKVSCPILSLEDILYEV